MKPAIIKRATDGTVTKVDANEQRTIYRTKDYSKFRFAPENREINKGHVERLKTSLAEYGFLADCPVHVLAQDDGGLLITDGQHRFTAARELELEILYILKVGTDVIRDIRIMHTYTKAWKEDDYLRHYVAQKLPSYEHLATFTAEYQTSIFAALNLLAADETTLTDIPRRFRLGDFTSSAETRENAANIMLQVNAIRFIHPRLGFIARDRSFVAALIRLVTHPQYEHKRMQAVIEKQIMSFIKCTNTANYLRQLTAIYNYKLAVHNRVDFEERA